MFDRILLMAEGRVAFLGNTNDAVDFFQNINRPCPYNFNPADHYIHVLAVRPGTEAQCREEINSICDSFAVTDAGSMVRFCKYIHITFWDGNNFCKAFAEAQVRSQVASDMAYATMKLPHQTIE